MERPRALTFTIPFFIINIASSLNGTEILGLSSTIPSKIPIFDALMPFKGILHEVLHGPLDGQRVTLSMPQNLSFMADDLVASLGIPVSIDRLSWDWSNGGDEVIFQDSSRMDEVHKESHNISKEPVWKLAGKDDVWLLIMEKEIPWWLFRNDNSITRRAMLIVSTSCWIPALESPLVEKTQAVALVCSNLESSPSPSDFRVLSWEPYASKKKLLNLGMWSLSSFPSWFDLFVDRFRDMGEKNFSVSANDEDEPLVYADEQGTPKGLNVEILDTLSSWLHFRNILEVSVEATWDVISDLVKRGFRDAMINFSTNTPDRYKDYDISVPYHYEGFGLVLEVPPPLPRWQNILYPFSRIVWLSVIASFVAVSVAYHILQSDQTKSFFDNAISIGQSLLSSPWAAVPSGWRLRTFLLQWWLASWILELSWICNLTAVLTIPAFPKKIQTKQELAESNYRLCMLDYGEFVPEALRTSEEPTLFSLGKKLDLAPLMMDWEAFGHEECVRRVLAGTHAQTETYSYIRIFYSKKNHNTKVYFLKEQLYPSYLSFRFPKNTPWKYKFDEGIQRLYESGLIQLWLRRAMEDLVGRSSQETSSKGLEPLTLDHLQGPFILLGFGGLLAFLLMGGEYFFEGEAGLISRLPGF